MNIDIKQRHEKKLKQLVVGMEKIAATNIENSLKATETYLKHEFGYVEEQSILEYKEYYRKLIMYYQFKLNNHFETINKCHEENYETMKNTIMKKNKDEFDLIEIKFLNKLQAQKAQIIPKLSLNQDGKKNKEKNECSVRQKSDKLDELKRNNQRLKFYKAEIKKMLNNYLNAVTSMEKQRFDYVLNKEKIFQKYLCDPTAVELEQLITYKIT